MKQEMENGEPQASSPRTTAERVTVAISALVIIGILGLITYLYVRGDGEPANVTVEAQFDALREENGAFYLPVEVRNEGGRTAADVIVEAELDTGTGQPESAEITVTYLAGGEHKTGAFVFTEDPSTGELNLRASSYKDP